MYSLDDLLYLMGRLRDKDGGCPWDLQQDYRSLVPCTLEEAYEVADAIEREDFQQLRDELGDLLFQVVYYSRLGAEEQRFDFAAVVDGIVRKLLRRHPHVFPDGDLYGRVSAATLDESAVRRRWEQIKADERAEKASQPEQLSLLDDVPGALPALNRAGKLQKRAASVGFDWTAVPPVLDKVHEEWIELQQAIAQADPAAQQEELGDLLFTLVNLARHLKLDPESALRQANTKFERRFRYLEQALRQAGRSFQQADAAELEGLWQDAKGRATSVVDKQD